MRYAPLLVLFLVSCCALPTWANGDSVVREADPRTGMLFPVCKTPAQVLHQQLSIRFALDDRVEFLEKTDVHRRAEWAVQRADIETTYTIRNPLERTETLTIAFAVPGKVTFPRPPVLFDGELIEWEYLDEDALWRMYLPTMLKSFEDALQKDEQLRKHLEHAYQIYKQRNGEWEAVRYLDEHARQFTKGFHDSIPLRVYAAYREKKPFPARFFARLLENIGRTESLPWARWDARKRFLHPITGKVMHPREMFPEWSYYDAAEGIVSLLLFRIALRPQTTHRLTVRYSQEPGYIRREGVADYPLIRGVHLTYLLRTQSWASYGPIDVEIKIPKDLRLRASSPLRFAEEQDGERVYRARILNPKSNLYITVANPDSFYSLPWQVINARGRLILSRIDAEGEEREKARLINGSAYLPVHSLASASEEIFYTYSSRRRSENEMYSPPNIEARWQAGRVLLEAEGRRIEVRAGKSTASVNGHQVALTKPPVFLNGHVWLHVRDYFAFALYLLDIPSEKEVVSGKKKRSLPQNLVRTHFDYHKALVTVILPF